MHRLCSRAFAFIALIAAAATPALAQEAGIKAGVNLATLDFPELPRPTEQTPRIALAGGLFMRSPEVRRFSVQVEALVSMKGTRYTEDAGEPDEEEHTLQFTYVELPVLLRYDVARSGRNGVHLFGGPALSRTLSTRATHHADNESEDIEYIRSWDYGVVAGVGVTRGRFVLDGRYEWGLRKIVAFPELEGQGPTVVDIRNRAFTVMAGVRF